MEQEVDNLVGLQVTDEAGYQAYRDGMAPILARIGGRFLLDVDVANVRLSHDDVSFNRLFVLRFPNMAALEAFFADSDYQRVRDEHFVRSVEELYLLGRYNVTS